MKKRTSINLITLVITAFLLIFVGRAWYVNNTKLNANNVIGQSASDSFRLELERGKYKNSEWTWENVNNLSITSMQPGDTFFFRFKITISKASRFNVSLNDVESVLQEDTLTRSLVGEKYYVMLNNTRLFEMSSATRCNVYSDLDGTVAGVLYNYDATNNKFVIDDYLVQNTFRFYDYGLQDETYFNTQDNDVSNDNDITGQPLEGQPLDNLSINYDASSITGKVVKYGYFALEFNEAASLVSYKHLDGTIKEDSNLYQAQTMLIKKFILQEM